MIIDNYIMVITEIVNHQYEIESMDTELLRHLEEVATDESFQGRVKEKIEDEYVKEEIEDGEIETRADLIEPLGILPVAAVLIISFATAADPAAGQAVGAAVGVAIGKIIAEEIEEWYQEREERQEVKTAVKGTVVEEESTA